MKNDIRYALYELSDKISPIKYVSNPHIDGVATRIEQLARGYAAQKFCLYCNKYINKDCDGNAYCEELYLFNDL
jgi:hypothetical protein